MISYKDELYHHGIKGQKWGVRRYQNPDGSLTNAGLHRYYGSDAEHRNRTSNNKGNSSGKTSSNKTGHKGLSDGQKKALKIGAAVAVAGLTAYGAYKLHQVSVTNDVKRYVDATNKDFDLMQKEITALRLNPDEVTSRFSSVSRGANIVSPHAETRRNTVKELSKAEAAFRRENAVAKVSDRLLGTSKAKSWRESPLQKWGKAAADAELQQRRALDVAATEHAQKYGQESVIKVLNKIRG